MKALSLSDISSLLTEEVLQAAFQEVTRCKENVQFVDISRASKPGEGFMSAVYRVTVQGATQSATFIAKGLIGDKQIRNSLDCEKYFKRESTFFLETLPILANFQKSLGARESIRDIIPVCYSACSDGENDYILMEDMSASGFRPIGEVFTVAERDISLKTLAHFHAVSIALRVKAPQLFNQTIKGLTELYYSESSRKWYSEYLRLAIEFDKKVLIELESSDSEYFKKFFEMLDSDVYGELIRLTTCDSEHRAILHGDAWYPNFLCGDDKAVAIDFQAVRCASPGIELAYFILLGSSMTFGKNDFDSAVDIYYKHLDYYLADMGLCSNDIFSRKDLDNELKLYGKFGLLACLTSFLLLASTEKFDTLEKKSENNENEVIPLEILWKLSEFKEKKDKIKLLNAVRVAVDVELI